ncbi:MAG: hypothetical protein WDW38_006604 [Sanguina aurantia]
MGQAFAKRIGQGHAEHVAKRARKGFLEIGSERGRQFFQPTGQFGVAGDIHLARRHAVVATFEQHRQQAAGRGRHAELATRAGLVVLRRPDVQTSIFHRDRQRNLRSAQVQLDPAPVERRQSLPRVRVQRKIRDSARGGERAASGGFCAAANASRPAPAG